jgi:hypothetical protein
MVPTPPKKDFNLYSKSISFIWTPISNDSWICLTNLLFEFNFIKIINEPSASTNPVTQLGSNTVKLLFLPSEYDLVREAELKDSSLFFSRCQSIFHTCNYDHDY